jgi:hypothetical protein
MSINLNDNTFISSENYDRDAEVSQLRKAITNCKRSGMTEKRMKNLYKKLLTRLKDLSKME